MQEDITWGVIVDVREFSKAEGRVKTLLGYEFSINGKHGLQDGLGLGNKVLVWCGDLITMYNNVALNNNQPPVFFSLWGARPVSHLLQAPWKNRSRLVISV